MLFQRPRFVFFHIHIRPAWLAHLQCVELHACPGWTQWGSHPSLALPCKLMVCSNPIHGAPSLAFVTRHCPLCQTSCSVGAASSSARLKRLALACRARACIAEA